MIRIEREKNGGSFLDRVKWFHFVHSAKTGYGDHPASYPMGNGNTFLGGKAAGA
jgi:hypothetical protein